MTILTLSFSEGDHKYTGGSPGGYTGSPGDGKNCTFCHNGSASAVTGWITSNVPGTGYTAGTSYTITITVSGSAGSKKGFEVSPQTISGNLVGTLTASPGTEIVPSGKALTQSSSITSATAIWTFTWVAPAAGTGPVTFYGAFTVGKSVTRLSTAVFAESNVGIEEQELSSPIVYPNPVYKNFCLGFALNHNNRVRVDLFDLKGRHLELLYSSALASGNQGLDLQLPDALPHGVYFLQLNTSETKRMIKFIH